MKKLVLVMVCAMLMALFIAFNYLLWDRENKEKDIQSLEHSNASNNASITVLGEKINKLEEDGREQKDKISKLENMNKLLQEDNSELQQEKEKMNSILVQRETIINILKQAVDSKLFEAPIRKWADALDKGEYKTAYDLYDRDLNDPLKTLSFGDFSSSYKNIVKSIKIKSLKLYIDENSVDKQGEIIFTGSFDVKIAEDADKSKTQWKDGQNERYFTIGFDAVKNDWIISKISSVP